MKSKLNMELSYNIKDFGNGFGEIINEVSFGESPQQKIANQITLAQDNQTKEVLKSLGYIYLSEDTRVRLKEELDNLRIRAYDLDEIEYLLETVLKGE